MAASLSHRRLSCVKDGLAIQPQCGPLSAIAPISDKTRRGQFVRKVPISDIRPATSDNCDAAYADGNLPPHYELGALIE